MKKKNIYIYKKKSINMSPTCEKLEKLESTRSIKLDDNSKTLNWLCSELKLNDYNHIIPPFIFQTHESKRLSPANLKAVSSWKEKNPEYTHFFFDSNDRLNFIKKYFSENVLRAYCNLSPPAFKADLWRYCMLYMFGGVYADSDMVCLKPLRSYISDEITFVGVRDDPMKRYAFLANGFFATVPKNPCLYEAIQKVCDNVKKEFYPPGCMGVCGPKILGEVINEGKPFDLGVKDGMLILKLKNSLDIVDENGVHLIDAEYGEKRKEIKLSWRLRNGFLYLWKRKLLYRQIPRTIYVSNSNIIPRDTEEVPFWDVKISNTPHADVMKYGGVWINDHLSLKDIENCLHGYELVARINHKRKKLHMLAVRADQIRTNALNDMDAILNYFSVSEISNEYDYRRDKELLIVD